VSGAIYAIRNVITGDTYIGSTRKPIKYRFKDHERGLRLGNHPNPGLQAAAATYGASAFAFEVLESVAHPRDLKEREDYWIAAIAADGAILYNIQPESRCSVTTPYWEYR
jgi:group I intron endonuclease